MALSDPAERELLHLRDIALRGFRRSDGLIDIEAEIGDHKTYGFAVGDRGEIPPGELLHRMQVRLTVDEGLTIVACEAVTLRAPFLGCAAAADTFGRLVGLTIRSGFLREANARIGGVQGCTHIRELLQQMATVAVQTAYVLPSRRRDDPAGADRMIDTCRAYAADGPVVRRRWPERYTGADAASAEAASGTAD